MDKITYQPIGVIHTPFKAVNGMPIQAVAAKGVIGSIELAPAYQAGLKDIIGFSHLILLYHLHLVYDYKLEVIPFLDDQPHGVFATRSPKRPNAIGLSIVKLLGVEANTLQIEEIDVIDGTPLLDIKPYVPEFDVRTTEQIGWFAARVANVYTVRAGERKLISPLKGSV
jgi:tRNA-Thr(GGU) m(6)t(6)A37 methyltransferase TsaA